MSEIGGAEFNKENKWSLKIKFNSLPIHIFWKKKDTIQVEPKVFYLSLTSPLKQILHLQNPNKKKYTFLKKENKPTRALYKRL